MENTIPSVTQTSELATRIAESIHRSKSEDKRLHAQYTTLEKRRHLTASIVDEHIAPLETENARLRKIIAEADGKDAASFDWSVLGTIDRLESACEAALPVIVDAIMHGMPVTPEVADARNKLVAVVGETVP